MLNFKFNLIFFNFYVSDIFLIFKFSYLTFIFHPVFFVFISICFSLIRFCGIQMNTWIACRHTYALAANGLNWRRGPDGRRVLSTRRRVFYWVPTTLQHQPTTQFFWYRNSCHTKPTLITGKLRHKWWNRRKGWSEPETRSGDGVVSQ